MGLFFVASSFDADQHSAPWCDVMKHGGHRRPLKCHHENAPAAAGRLRDLATAPSAITGNSFSMPHRRKLQRAELRVVILRAIIEIVRTYYHAYFKTEKFGADIELGFILFAVMVGQAEEQLMSATDISNYLGLPRPTVARKLKQLGKSKSLRTVRDGRRVCYWIENPNSPEIMASVDKVIGIIRSANRQLSKLADVGIDHRVAKH